MQAAIRWENKPKHNITKHNCTLYLLIYIWICIAAEGLKKLHSQVHLLLKVFSLGFTFLFHTKWDSLCWQNSKCINTVYYSWPYLQLNPPTSKTLHTPQSNKPTPELYAQGTTALKKEHWLHGLKAAPCPTANQQDWRMLVNQTVTQQLNPAF